MLAWWHLRSRRGRVLLRIEDLDRERCKPEFEAAIFEDLEWLGLDWDGEVERQSRHLARFEVALEELESRGALYPCVCTRKEIELAAAAPHAEDGTLAYPGTCRDRFPSHTSAKEETGRGAAMRFRAPNEDVAFTDQFVGESSANPALQFGDFPVTRRDGTPAYQLAVVVDDAAQGVTEVHRGADLLASTPSQIQLARALGRAEPRWIHFPLVLDPSGRRLAKRHDDLSLRELRSRGVTPSEILTWIAESAGVRGASQFGRAKDLPPLDLAAIPRSDVRLDERWNPPA